MATVRAITLFFGLALALLPWPAPAERLSFAQGVAAGEVTASTAVLWTRAAPGAVLLLEIALDPDFRNLFYRAVPATAEADYTVKVLVDNLAPETRYYYRFRAAGAASPTGTFRTAPEVWRARPLRFAWSGDSDGTPGPDGVRAYDFRALDALRAAQPDFFVYLGDTVYQDSPRRTRPAGGLEEYRDTYRSSREAPALRTLLASTPTYAVWDDHEILNDFDGLAVEPARYAAGRRAFFDYLPVAGDPQPLRDPSCPGDPLFRRFPWGADAEILVLDTRTCRSADVEASCRAPDGTADYGPTLPPAVRAAFGLPPEPPPGCREAIHDPARTMLGPVQKQAFLRALRDSRAAWKFVISSVPIQELFARPYDRWEGYAAERREILSFVRRQRIGGVVFLAADLHAQLANDVFIDKFDGSAPVAAEFVTGPIGAPTFQESVLNAFGGPGLFALFALFRDVAEVRCLHLDARGYGLARIAPAGEASIALHDEMGGVVMDQLDRSRACAFDLGVRSEPAGLVSIQ